MQPRISDDDYFIRSKEFRVWLKTSKKKCVTEIPSKKARKYFSHFVKLWNEGKLEAMYYRNEFPTSIADSSLHKWKFKETTGESLHRESVKDAVSLANERYPSEPAHSGSFKDAPAKRPERTDEDRTAAIRDRKRYNNHRKMVEEELVPKPTDRDARIEKRKEVGSRLHGSSKAKEALMDGFDIPESVTMGGGGDFSRQVAGERRRKQGRAAEREKKLAAFEAKQKQQEERLRAQFGVEGGGRITIRPREDY